MKKSEQYSNKALNRGSIRRLFTVPVIICLVIFSLTFITSTFFDTDYLSFFLYEDGSSYSLITNLRYEARYIKGFSNYEPYYYLSASSLASGTQVIWGILLAALQFNFLLNKKSCYTQLSFAVDRKRLFTIKTLIPLLIPASVIVAVNIIVFILNAVYIGASLSLLAGILLAILTSLMSLVLGYTATVAGHLFAARRTEAYVFTYAILNVVSTITAMVNFILPQTLYGYSYYDSLLNSLDTEYSENINNLYYSYDYYPVSEGAAFISDIVAYAVALLILGGILALFKLYFVKKFKAEQSGVRGKSRIVLVTSCTVVALSIVHSFTQISALTYTLTESSIPFTTIFIIAVIASIILCLIICILSTLSPKKLVWGATAAGITVVLHLIILGIGCTGAFGYATRIPDADKIMSVEITLPFDEMNPSNGYNEGSFFSSQFYSNSITATNDKDIEIVRNIHKAAIDNRENETGITLSICYYMENGSIISRSYENVSIPVSNEMLNLWETEEVKKNLRLLLNQATKEELAELEQLAKLNDEEILSYTGSGSVMIDSYEADLYYETPLSTLSNMYLISKDYSATKFDFFSDEGVSADFTEDVILDIMGALYKDACTLSAKEWFMPEKELGALVFSPYAAYSNTYNGSFSSNDCAFYINTNMTNTLKVLEKYGYLDFFSCDKEIAEAHLIDISEVCNWIGYSYNYIYNSTSSFHGTYFSQINTEINDYLEEGCEYFEYVNNDDDEYFDDEYFDDEDYVDVEYYDEEIYIDDDYDDSLFGFETEAPELNPTKLTDEKQIKKLIDNGYLAYNVGSNGKFLVIKYSDGTSNMLVIPNK